MVTDRQTDCIVKNAIGRSVADAMVCLAGHTGHRYHFLKRKPGRMGGEQKIPKNTGHPLWIAPSGWRAKEAD